MKTYIIEYRDNKDFKQTKVIFTALDIDANQRYKDFVKITGESLGLVINKHWVDTVADFQKFHADRMTIEQYKSRVKEFKKFLKEYDFEAYLLKYCAGEEIKFTRSGKFGHL